MLNSVINKYRFIVPILIALLGLVISVCNILSCEGNDGYFNLPIPFTTGVCFIITGILLFNFSSSTLLNKILCYTLILVPALILPENFVSCFYTLDIFNSSENLSGDALNLSRMSINTGVSFILISIYIIGHKRLSRLFSGVIISTVLTIGFIGVSGYIYQSPIGYSWISISKMAFPTAIGLILIGIYLKTLQYNKKQFKRRSFVFLGLFIAFTLLILDFGFSSKIGAGVIFLVLIYYSWIGESEKEIYFFTILAFSLNFAVFVVSFSQTENILNVTLHRLVSSILIIAVGRLLYKTKQKGKLLQKNKLFFESIFEQSHDGLLIFKDNGKIIRYNAKAKLFLNIQDDLEDFFQFFTPKHKSILTENGKINSVVLNKFLNLKNNTFHGQINGEPICLKVSIYPFQSNGKNYYSLLLTDITDFEKQNLEIKEHQSKLVEMNNEMRDFLYIVCHDIEEPIRTINSFAKFSIEKFGNDLPDKVNEYLKFIQESGNRLHGIIEDLSSYNNLGKKRNVSKVNVKDLFTNTMLDLDSLIKAKKAIIKLPDTMPTIPVYITEFRLLIQNLLHNAIKFHSEDRPLEIIVSYKQYPNEYIFAIRDNGIGISEDFQDKIFKVFYRINGKSGVKGNGIGLSICKKVAELHGGEIWVKSNPDFGVTFYFSVLKSNLEYD